MTDDLYLLYLLGIPASSDKPNPPAQASIPDDILPFVQRPARPASKPNPTAQASIPDDILPFVEQPQQSRVPGLPDLPQDIEQPETTAHDLEFAWSSEQPYMSLNAAELSYYTSAQEDDLVRQVAISLQHEKFILDYLEDPIEYLKIFATYTWDEESDEAAEEFIQWYVARFRADLEQQREIERSTGVLSEIEYWTRDFTNDKRERLVAIDLDTGETVFLRYGDEDSVTVQDLQKKLAEGRNVVLLHNHPNNTAASLADLAAADWLDTEYMIVVNPDGTQHRYTRRGGTLVELVPTRNPGFVAPVDPRETAAAERALWLQTLSEIGNPAEMVMEQGEAEDRIHTPAGLTVEQVYLLFDADIEAGRVPRHNTDFSEKTFEQKLSAWENKWTADPTSWIDYDAIRKRLPIITDATERWNHPALGMSDDEMAALLIANLHREAHYRRQNPTVYKMSPGEFFLNLGDRAIIYFKNQAVILARVLTDGDPSVGPANLRIRVANEMLGARVIPMPDGEQRDFYDMGRLDSLEKEWQNLNDSERRKFLGDDAKAIELMAANIYRGVERLYQQYLKDHDLLEQYLQHQSLLAQGVVEQYRQQGDFPQQVLEQQQYLQQYLQQDKFRATMFNLSAWSSQGIVESDKLNMDDHDDHDETYNAINHARETVPFVSGILGNNAFGLSPDQDGFSMFNEDDLHAYLRD